MKPSKLLAIKNGLDNNELSKLSEWACLSRDAIRLNEGGGVLTGHRQNFSIDADRILHSLAYSRYIDKTQVFSLIKNDHITHRVLHVQLVSKIARTIGRLLKLNEDLIEAIALGHDIGHSPFGHDGEKYLSHICVSYGIGNFLHNVQGVMSLQSIERKGKGWNLSLQVLDGILCHDGELHAREIRPAFGKNFTTLNEEIKLKINNPFINIFPMTMEGCVVRMADTISYIGRDIEDAIRLDLIRREDIPSECSTILGNTNGTIVYTLVEDLVANSLHKDGIRFSEPVGEALRTLKEFNLHNIYLNPKVKGQSEKVRFMFEQLFDKYMHDLTKEDESSDIFNGFLNGMSDDYRKKMSQPEIVRDFLAGMTDEYFLSQYHKNFVPQIRSGFK